MKNPGDNFLPSLLLFQKSSDPTIENDTPFKSCKSPDEFYCQEISNDLQSHVTNDIMKQLHYDVWRTVDEIIASKDETNNNGTNDVTEDRF